MTRTLLAAALALSLTIAVVSARRCAASARDERGARLALARTAADAGELRRLRGHAAEVAPGRRPEPGLIEQLRSALADAGLPREALTSLQPGAESAAGDPRDAGRYVRQTAVATLQPVRLADLGRVLDAWRRRDTGWNPDSIQLAPVRLDDPHDADPALRVIITLGALYFDGGSP